MQYRPEIDGLRAIAVLAVLIYHAEFSVSGTTLLTGGYLGVDIFFVISGFLITTIIFSEVTAGKFSFLHFYERRARRILPALFAVIIVCTVVAWMLILPDAFIEFSSSVIAAIFLGSNILFWTQDSYTAEPSALKPLLHTWSLGVEEQFYVLFPFLLIAVRKWPIRRIQGLVSILLIASLVYAQFASYHFPEANFFLLPSRIWELLTGSLLALLQFGKQGMLRRSHLSEALSLAALFILLLCFINFDEQTRHPSLITAIPIACVALLIARAPTDTGIVHTLLSNRIAVFLGLISYSLYLWHFPLFAFVKLADIALSNQTRAMLLVFALCLAAVSYKLIEQPFRKRGLISARLLSRSIGVSVTLLLVFHISGVIKLGYPERLGNTAEKLTNLKPPKVENGIYPLKTTLSDTPLTLINVGDSHAEMYSYALKNMAVKNSANFIQMTQSGCPLVLNIYRFDDGVREGSCNPQRTRIWLDHVLEFKDSIVIYSGRFNLYWRGQRYQSGVGELEPGPELLITTRATGEENIHEFRDQVVGTIQTMTKAGLKVVLVYPSPEIGWHVPRSLSNELRGIAMPLRDAWLANADFSFPYQEYAQRSEITRRVFDSLGDSSNILRLYPEDVLCDESKTKCRVKHSSDLYYYDDNHLSRIASGKVVENLERELRVRGWLKN